MSEHYYNNLQKNRKHVIYLLERDWPITRHGQRNGRKLNRLSTKQLVAKLRRMHKIVSGNRAGFVSFLDSVVA